MGERADRGVRPAAGLGALRWILAAAAVLFVVGVAIPLGASMATAAAAPAPRLAPSPPAAAVKYYIVGPPVNGQQEYLFEIAVKTLGNGNRYPEIFALNRGRLQADGGRLEDPTELQAGWILLLPNDARGPTVHIGPLPAAQRSPPLSPPVQSSPAPVRSVPAPGAGESSSWSTIAPRLGVVAAAVVLMAFALGTLRRARTRADAGANPAGPKSPRSPSSDGRRPPIRSIFPKHRAEPADDPEPLDNPEPPDNPEAPVPREPFDAPEPFDDPEPSVDPEPFQEPHPVKEPIRRVEPVRSEPLPSTRSAQPSPEAVRTRAPAGQLAADATGSSARAPEPWFHVQVMRGPDIATVHIVDGVDSKASRDGGARARQGRTDLGSAYLWLPPPDDPPVAQVTLYVGGNASGSLYLCLAHAPDLVTITGEPAGRRRLALAFAEEAAAAGHRVTVVDQSDVLVPLPLGVRQVAGVDALPVVNEPDKVEVVICNQGPIDDLAPMRALAGGASRRTAVVVVGEVPPARWSVDVQPAV